MIFNGYDIVTWHFSKLWYYFRFRQWCFNFKWLCGKKF